MRPSLSDAGTRLPAQMRETRPGRDFWGSAVVEDSSILALLSTRKEWLARLGEGQAHEDQRPETSGLGAKSPSERRG